MSKLDRIEILNFKSIKELNLELHPLNVFIGPNGVGKSNFVGAFEFLNKLIDGNLQSFTRKSGGANSLLRFGRKQLEPSRLILKRYGWNGRKKIAMPISMDQPFQMVP